ncbi:hypothetical protein RJ639_010357 [Escallonia herrerae]|uniref:Uncharacterized protein n=1 Tax=Escallonia herrerae TaxID=1293975 RepID=A0AA89APY8_9ASTE|nr:hypothetical protein RJ639_010357 [Escallonia herrerae]
MEEKNHTKSSCTYHMNGGNGPDSYTQNSTYQKGLVGAAKQLIYELIDEKLDIVESHSSNGVLHAQTSLGMGYDLFGSCLEELANMGRIDAEKVDSFSLPFYYPCPKELKALVETNGCFNIVKIEILNLPVREEDLRNPRMCAKHFRAVIQGAVEENFGPEIVGDLFERLVQKLEANAYIFDHEYRKETRYFVSLDQA